MFSFLTLLLCFVFCRAEIKRTILITGSSDGIGRETAGQLSNDSSNFIILHGRNASRCWDASEWLRQKSPLARYTCVIGEFRDLHSVKSMVQYVKYTFPNLNVLLLNAGIWAADVRFTEQKFEETFQVNHLAHFLIAHELRDTLERNAPSRIVITSSGLHRWVQPGSDWENYNATDYSYSLGLYSRSKFYNVLMSDYLAEELKDKGVTVNSLHPGHLKTKLNGWTGKPVNLVETPHYLAVSPQVEGLTGRYFGQYSRESSKNSLATVKENQENLWDYSTDFLKNNNFI